MRMLTKQWYQTMTDGGLGVCLEIDDRAAESSDGVFQAVWAEKLAAWLQMRAEICPILEEEFDEAGERQRFEENYAREMEGYQTRTPGKILEKVADIRLLALGICTEAVFKELEEYRSLCEKRTEEIMEKVWELQQAQGLAQHWTGEHSLHDSFVLSLNREGADLILEFERDEDVTWPEIRAIRFRDAKILNREQPVDNAWWLYDEIWKSERGYEVHGLLWKDGGVFELTIECRDTELVWTVEPKTE